MSKCPYQSSDKGRKYFHYSQKGEEGGGDIEWEAEQNG